jgi:hypothetical protein
VAKIRRDDGGIRDPLEEGEDRSQGVGPSSSRNREESKTGSGKDAFGKGRTTGLGGESRRKSKLNEPDGMNGAGGKQ